MTGVYYLRADTPDELEYAKLPCVNDGHIKHLCCSQIRGSINSQEDCIFVVQRS